MGNFLESYIENFLFNLINCQNAYEKYQKNALNKINYEREYRTYILLFLSLGFIFFIYKIWKKKEIQEEKPVLDSNLNDSFSSETAYNLIRELQPKSKIN